MKIAIIGTHSTGKTTLARHLGQHFSAAGNDVHYLPEFARVCPFPINEATTLDAQVWILENQIKHENAKYQDGIFFICDRATIDNFAYMYRAMDGEGVGEYEKKAVDHMNTYDLVFKTTKLNIDARYDKVRTTDGVFRNQIDKEITRLLEKHNIDYHPLPATIDLPTHLAFILEKIKDKKTR